MSQQETVQITKVDFTNKVNEGWKRAALATHYGLPESDISKILKQLGLKIRKFHNPRFVLIDSEETAVQHVVTATDVANNPTANLVQNEVVGIPTQALHLGGQVAPNNNPEVTNVQPANIAQAFQTTEPQATVEVPVKKKRRTKAEIEADKLAKAEAEKAKHLANNQSPIAFKEEGMTEEMKSFNTDVRAGLVQNGVLPEVPANTPVTNTAFIPLTQTQPAVAQQPATVEDPNLGQAAFVDYTPVQPAVVVPETPVADVAKATENIQTNFNIPTGANPMTGFPVSPTTTVGSEEAFNAQPIQATAVENNPFVKAWGNQ